MWTRNWNVMVIRETERPIIVTLRRGVPLFGRKWIPCRAQQPSNQKASAKGGRNGCTQSCGLAPCYSGGGAPVDQSFNHAALTGPGRVDKDRLRKRRCTLATAREHSGQLFPRSIQQAAGPVRLPAVQLLDRVYPRRDRAPFPRGSTLSQ